MSAKKEIENQKKRKLQLAEKYERLSKVANSQPKRQTFRNKAADYRHQLKMLEVGHST
jgi:hypothetical protein